MVCCNGSLDRAADTVFLILTYDGVHPGSRGVGLPANPISDGIVRALAVRE